MTSEQVELRFGVSGTSIPLDHGYALYSAISRLTEVVGTPSWFHEAESVALILINGIFTGNGELRLSRASGFGIRLPAADIPRVLSLAGRRLNIGGTSIRVGTFSTRSLIPATTVRARIVTTRNGDEEARFDAEIARQFATLQIRGKVDRGRRRIITIHDKKVVGHELLVSELTPDESIRLQEHGLGGRRKMGCGVFVPHKSVTPLIAYRHLRSAR